MLTRDLEPAHQNPAWNLHKKIIMFTFRPVYDCVFRLVARMSAIYMLDRLTTSTERSSICLTR